MPSSLPPGVTPSNAARYGLIQPLQMVGSRTGMTPGGAIHGSDTAVTAQMKHKLFGSPSEITLVYAGYGLAGNTGAEAAPIVGSYRVRSLTVPPGGGGTGYVVGDIFTLPAGARLCTGTGRVQAVNAGVVTKVAVVDSGGYIAPFADGSATTGGTGTGLTVNAEWEEFAYVMNVAVYPDFSATNQVAGDQSPRLVSAGLEPGGGKRVNLAIPLGGHLVCDPVPLPAGVGDYIGLKYASSGAIGSFVNHGRRSIGLSEYVQGGVTGANQVLSQTTITFTNANPGPQPALILGRVKKRLTSFFLISHSFGAASATDGSGDAGDTTTGLSNWFERAVGVDFPSHTWARGGGSYADMFFSSEFRASGRSGLMKLLAMARPTDVIIDRSLNDIQLNGSTAAVVQQYEKTLVAEVRRVCNPDRIWLVTTTPRTSSTDGWATTGNQTIQTALNTQIQARNSALRAGTWAAGHDRYLDWGTVLETSLGSGIWVPGMTMDGIHPNEPMLPTIAASMRAQIVPFVPAN